MGNNERIVGWHIGGSKGLNPSFTIMLAEYLAGFQIIALMIFCLVSTVISK